MSIVNGVNGVFGHEDTALSGWLGSNASNNESGLAQFYFAEFDDQTQTAPYSVNRVNNLTGEAIWTGVTSSGQSAFVASANDMLSTTNGCIKRH